MGCSLFWFVVFGSLFVVGFDCFGYELCDELWGCVWVFPGVGVDFKWYRDWETDRKSTRLNSSHRL